MLKEEYFITFCEVLKCFRLGRDHSFILRVGSSLRNSFKVTFYLLTWEISLFSVCFHQTAITYSSQSNKWIPQLNLCVLEALRHKVNRLVGLVLVRLHCRLLGVKRFVLRLIRQRILEGQGQRLSGKPCKKMNAQRHVWTWRTHSRRALRKMTGVQRRKLSLLRSACTGQTPQWTNITIKGGNTNKKGRWRYYLEERKVKHNVQSFS